MIQHSGDFMRKRISTDFLPYAIQFLKDNHKKFTKVKSMFTRRHKVQRKLITFLGNVVPTLDLKKDMFSDISDVCSLYLSCHLHSSIQEVGSLFLFSPSGLQFHFNS